VTGARLAVGAGTGRLARRPDGLLFVGGRPADERWGRVIDGYLDAEQADDAREVVTSAAVAAGFALEPFVMVAWGQAIELLVLGEIEVRTDLPSVPMLSGATSATWVEHRVARPPATAQLSAGTVPDLGTRLDAGVVAAGGFAVTLAIASPDVPGARPVPREPAPEPDGVDLEMTLRPPGQLTAAGGGLVRARRCGNGHANPPHAAQCRVCGDLIGPASAVETMAQPVLGHVVLPDGAAIPVDRTSVLGRKPDAGTARADPAARLVPLDVSADVSRTHLVIRAEGWAMTATDCGSRGRTVLRPTGAGEPEVLEPWVPHEIAVGDTLYLGGPTQLQVVAS
jgi:hypothetical protein